ncbi:MAG: cell wall metabolism sensor histidine kinase WalK [Lachnospiraceae bacterium]|nr:cell wall metabolism sensor histidine kinase WalK [Lachnospiraceae bacterium]
MKDLVTLIIKKSAIMRSLKFRIFIIVLLVGVIPAFVMRVTLVKSYEQRAVNQRITDVTTQCVILCSRLAEAGYLSDPSDPVVNEELSRLSNFYDGRILVVDGAFRVVKDSYGMSEGKTVVSREVIACMNGSSNMSNHDEVNGYLEITVPITIPEKGTVLGVMVASASTDPIQANKTVLNQRAWIIEVTIAIFVLAIAYALSATLLLPFDKVISAINSAKEGFDTSIEPVDIPDYTETSEIMEAFYHLMNQIKEVDSTREEFVANVSHELKTPLASMKVLSDSIRNEENVPVEMYREFMNDIADEVDRENKIITDLLSMVKLDKQAGTLNLEETDINQLMAAILKRLKPLAEKGGIELIYEGRKEVVADVDETKFTLVITNLVENAIKYNRENGWVKVVLDADIQFMILTVSDNGIGIPDESLNHIYDRFYRVDKSHSSQIGGTGLGLAITRATILLHKGSIKASSVEGEGTTFTVRIPLNLTQTL